ncbi:hypothetical protein IC582_020284 [Cucumis melo]
MHFVLRRHFSPLSRTTSTILHSRRVTDPRFTLVIGRLHDFARLVLTFLFLLPYF